MAGVREANLNNKGGELCYATGNSAETLLICDFWLLEVFLPGLALNFPLSILFLQGFPLIKGFLTPCQANLHLGEAILKIQANWNQSEAGLPGPGSQI